MCLHLLSGGRALLDSPAVSCCGTLLLMHVPEALGKQLSTVLGCAPAQLRFMPVGGGDAASAFRVDTPDRCWFLKISTAAPGMLSAEADGLAALADSRSIRVPEVRAQGEGWLLLEWLALERPGNRCEAALGRRLADMHSPVPERFGWHRDNFIGLAPQYNPRMSNWPDFFREDRLQPQLQWARENGLGRPGTGAVERLCERLQAFFPAPVEAALVHGDLWQGNVGACEGEPVIFDPAVHYAHHEVDLAMLELFGGPGPEFRAGYEQLRPVAPEYRQRRDLYNLYHVLNHFNLFGGGYGRQAVRMAEGLLAELT